ncbi:MAG: aminopeptidase P family protein [Lachnospiraceae bacterium]|nr:aminopeptidase P family protein [Lachnospiraceae bacterium]
MQENTIIRERLARLRVAMARRGVDACLIPTADHHQSEYVADHFKAREYFCGFTGSNGTLVVLNDEAGLWTDGRYFIQAERELAGTGVTLYRMADEGVLTINEFLKEKMRDAETLAFDGRCITASFGQGLEEDLTPQGVRLDYGFDPAEAAWPERPALPCHPVYVIEDALAGKGVRGKLSEVRAKLSEEGAQCLLLTGLDAICWLFNIRGNDVECSPVALSYALIDGEETSLFIQNEELTDAVREHLSAAGVKVRDYREIGEALAALDLNGRAVLLDRKVTSYAVKKSLEDAAERTGGRVIEGTEPVTLLKAVKNGTELANIREVYLRDSAALTRFLYWVKTNIGKVPMDEVSVAKRLDGMRAELPGFIELSFPTISAYGANAAMMHYEATPEKYDELKPEGVYLVDSGGTYMGGTTDVTRTIALGPVSDEIRKHFTAVAVGMLRLANARFLKGCTGRNLDILARGPMWDMNIDYKCGTGHGIGYILNVHEGPHNIRWRALPGEKEAEILPGMIVSDEPGVYIEGSHGIRTENILEVTEGVKNGDGQFLGFAMLTWVPLDLDLIDPAYLDPASRTQLNEYHCLVREKLEPLIEEEEIREWLREATRAI